MDFVGQDTHIYKYEAGGAAGLGCIQTQSILFDADGAPNLDIIKSITKRDENHSAKTKLLLLENTTGAKVYLNKVKALVDAHPQTFHFDGCQLFNAVVSQKVYVKQITTAFDSISI